MEENITDENVPTEPRIPLVERDRRREVLNFIVQATDVAMGMFEEMGKDAASFGGLGLVLRCRAAHDDCKNLRDYAVKALCDL